jgi:16S rRNA (cytosine967-C5)-methyltransferase
VSRANPGRVAAARVLVAVEDGATAEAALAEWQPAGRDGGLARFLALGALRRRGHVDAALRPGLSRPLDGLDPGVRAALRVAAFELIFGRTGRHVGVSQGVEIVKALKLGRAKGLVNAVLRRTKEPANLRRSDALDLPPWLAARWDERYGTATVDQWAARWSEPAPLSVVVRDDEARDALISADLSLTPGEAGGTHIPNTFWVEGHSGPIPTLPGFEAGRLWIADPSAVAVADLAMGRHRILDACAAPGGKSMRLACGGADVLAVDRDAERLERVSENASRLSLDLPIHAHDWLSGPLPDVEPFDAVLVDAPCSGLGTIRRHPDIRWRRQPADLPRAAGRQLSILHNASTHVRPEGMLIYAVCSPEPEEGREVVNQFLADHPDFRLDVEVDTAPPSSHEDAHYAARLLR